MAGGQGAFDPDSFEKNNASSSIQSSDFVNASLRAQSLKALKCLGYL